MVFIHHSQQSHCLSHTKDFAVQTEMVAVETSIDVGNILWIFYDCLSPKKTQFHSVHHLSIWTEYYYLSECTLAILPTEEATMRCTALICLQKCRLFGLHYAKKVPNILSRCHTKRRTGTGPRLPFFWYGTEF